MGRIGQVGVAALVVVVAIVVYFHNMKRVSLPSHLLGHPAAFQENLLTADQASRLRDTMKAMKEIPTNIQDVRFYKTLFEDIGEARPIEADGTCSHPYLTPNNAKTQCVLPGRIDIGRHFILSGGAVGLKESYDIMTTRVQSFGRYIFNPDDYPIMKELFHSQAFQKAARSVCPPHKPVLDVFQFNYIVQLPGQTVALHIDAPYFWGASRFHYPQWLLAAMVFSGLWQDEFIDQVQVVAYFHDWNATDVARDGEFVYWNAETREPIRVPPTSLAGTTVDGSKTVHAASVYKPGVHPPFLDKSADNKLILIPESEGGDGDTWALFNGKEVLRTYTTNDLRLSVVYRARCFETEAEQKRYNDSKDEHMGLDNILQKFAEDLVKRGKVPSAQAALDMERLDLALLLLDTYISYPLPPRALIPYNYCALPRLLPWTRHILAPFCS